VRLSTFYLKKSETFQISSKHEYQLTNRINFKFY